MKICFHAFIYVFKQCILFFLFVCSQPNRMLSPTTVLKIQKGDCFEYSTLLCSLLISAGYDAYVVSGYATKETCLADERREICPLLKKKEEVCVYAVCFILPFAIIQVNCRLCG